MGSRVKFVVAAFVALTMITALVALFRDTSDGERPRPTANSIPTDRADPPQDSGDSTRDPPPAPRRGAVAEPVAAPKAESPTVPVAAAVPPAKPALSHLSGVTGIARDDASDRPLGNAELRMGDKNRGSRFEPIKIHTDPEGRFSIPRAIAIGFYRFTILETGHGPRSLVYDVRSTHLDLEFPSYPTFTIRCFDAETKLPLSGARVIAEPSPEVYPVELFDLGATDVGGTLRVHDLMPMTWIGVERSGYCRNSTTVPPAIDFTAETQYVDVHLNGAAFIRGMVTDWSNRPLAGMRISTESARGRRHIESKDDAEDEDLETRLRWVHGFESHATRTDAEGRFVLEVPPGPDRLYTVYAIDPEGRLLERPFPVAKTEKAGDSVDVGTVTLVESARTSDDG